MQQPITRTIITLDMKQQLYSNGANNLPSSGPFYCEPLTKGAVQGEVTKLNYFPDGEIAKSQFYSYSARWQNLILLGYSHRIWKQPRFYPSD